MKKTLYVLSCLCGLALCAFAQQPVAQNGQPVANLLNVTDKEQTLLSRMESIVNAGKENGGPDMSAATAVLNEAGKLPVSDGVMRLLVSMLAGAFPDQAPRTAAIAAKSYGVGLTPSALFSVIQSATLSQPEPFASVIPICDAVKTALGSAPLAADVPAIAVAVAEACPDNPLKAVANEKDTLEDRAGGGSLVLPGIEAIKMPTAPSAPVSDSSGASH